MVSAIPLLREQLGQAHAFLQVAMDDVTAEQAHWQPPGVANPIGATYAHVLLGEDAFIAMLSGRQPLGADERARQAGLSELPPLAAAGSILPLSPDWHAWGRRVRVDLMALRSYGEAVQQASDDYLAGLKDEDLDAPIDLSAVGFGERSLGWLLSGGLIGHLLSHWGEIVCLKGLQGSKGFPV